MDDPAQIGLGGSVQILPGSVRNEVAHEIDDVMDAQISRQGRGLGGVSWRRVGSSANMNNAWDEFSASHAGGMEISVIHASGVVAIQDDQSTSRERFNVITELAVQQARAVEVIFPPR